MGLALPPKGRYGVGLVFLSQDATKQARARERAEAAGERPAFLFCVAVAVACIFNVCCVAYSVRKAGQIVIGWRIMPVRSLFSCLVGVFAPLTLAACPG